MKKGLEVRLKRIFLYFFVLISIIFFMFPLYWILITSLQEKESLFVRNLSFIPREITLINYIDLFSEGRFNVIGALLNSLRVASITAIVCILLGILSAYSFARLRFKGSSKIFYLLIFTEMLPPISFLIPFYLIFKRIHLLNTWYGLVIGYTAWLLPIITWILYSYFKSIPQDLEDAARADGCSRIGALFRIILPVSAPGIVASGIVCFMFSMGEFLFALTISTSQKAHTLPVELTVFLSKYGVEYGKITATAVLTLMIPVVLVLIFQKYLIEGLTKGAVKE